MTDGVFLNWAVVVGIFAGFASMFAFMWKMWTSLDEKISSVEIRLDEKITKVDEKVSNLTNAFNDFSKNTDHRITALEVEWKCLTNPKKIVVIDSKADDTPKEN